MFHHSGVETRLHVVEKSVLKSNPANMQRDCRDILVNEEDGARHAGYLPSTGVLGSPVKRVARYVREEISIYKPAVVNKHSLSVSNSVLPLDLSAYPLNPNT